jgi:hypothetical protein
MQRKETSWKTDANNVISLVSIEIGVLNVGEYAGNCKCRYAKTLVSSQHGCGSPYERLNVE